MILYCLDTNIISYLLKGKYGIAERIKKELRNDNEMMFNKISYYEVLRGLKYIDNSQKIEQFNQMCNLFDFLELDNKTFELAAEIYSKLRSEGTLIDDADLIIAANCIVNNAVLVTNNVKHFKRIASLRYVNWVN